MELKEVIHIYLGCDVLIAGQKATLAGIWPRRNNEDFRYHIEMPDQIYLANLNEFHPILRKLEDMTEEEKKVVGFDAYGVLRQIVYAGETKPLTGAELNFRWIATQFNYMVKQRFDIFGLIPAGFAIDEKTIVT